MAGNYLLGKAERLMRKIPAPQNDVKPKKHPYTFTASQERLLKKLPSLTSAIDGIVDAACPQGESVSLLTIHPSYLAKTYFPKALFAATGLVSIGSRQRLLVPDNPSPKHSRGDVETGLELFVSGTRDRFHELERVVKSMKSSSPLADELIKIEDIRIHESSSKIKIASYDLRPISWEAVLHASSSESGDNILNAFVSFVNSHGGTVDLDRRMYAGGLCFVPVYGDAKSISDVAEFSFLRVIRGMPRIRPVIRAIGSKSTFECKPPDVSAMDDNLRVIIFDGGPVDVDGISKWVINADADNIGPVEEAYREHAIGVASAALFGPIFEGLPLERPYSNVEVVRVIDKGTAKEHPDYFDVLTRIDSYLADNDCDFVNLSLGPDWPVEDDEPHAWTSVLDRRFYEKRKQTLAFCAVGNNGENEWLSGNARVQPPSDCVNAVAVGSCSSTANNWRRSSHSCIGFGRVPGRVRPEILALGGDDGSPFFVIGQKSGTAIPVIGTSYATPTAMRSAVGIRACLGNELQPMAIRALIINRADDGGLPMREVGWGRMQHSVADLLTSEDNTANIIYQRSIKPGQWLSAEIPLPENTLQGYVELSATVCYATPTEPENPINYTQAGIEIRFRPHIEKFAINKETKKPRKNPSTKPLFTLANMYGEAEAELREDAHKWETVLNVKDVFLGTSLKQPTLEIHYNAREGGAKTGADIEIAFALVVTVRCKNEPQLYNKIVARYPSILQQIKPLRLPVGRISL